MLIAIEFSVTSWQKLHNHIDHNVVDHIDTIVYRKVRDANKSQQIFNYQSGNRK